MRKGELGLQRSIRIGELKDRYNELCNDWKIFAKSLRNIGLKKIGFPKDVKKLFDTIFDALEENEFLDKNIYCLSVMRIGFLEGDCELINHNFIPICNDFGGFSLFEFIVLAQDLLEVATYDSLICPDYPCTSEIVLNGKFSYYEADDDTNEIVIDTPEKCWDYLKENYDSLED